MNLRAISAAHFISLTPACGFGCVIAALMALTCDARLVPMLAIAAAFGICLSFKRRNASVSMTILVGAVVLATAQSDLSRRVSSANEGERVVAHCLVDSLPQISANGVSLSAECRAVLPRKSDFSLTATRRLSVRLPPGTARELPRAGETWQWLLELHVLQAPLNPGMVDIERQWYRERVHGLARVRASTYTRRLTESSGLLHWRATVADAIEKRVDDRDARALLAALAVGATGELTREQWRVFAVTGITHLIAISGMHVTAFAMVAIALARRLWRGMSASFRLRIDCERFAVLLGLAVALAYAALAGMSVPTQRTLVMLLIAATARLAARRIAPDHLLALAVIAVLAIDPYAPLAAGFWLSFVAVAVLMAAGNAPLADARPRKSAARSAWSSLGEMLRSLLGATRLQWLVVTAMMPLTLALFGTVPVTGLLVNLLAIPLFSVLLVPLTLLGMALLPLSVLGIELAQPVWHLAELIWVQIAPALQVAADFPAAAWRPDVSTAWLLTSPMLALCAILRLPLALRLATSAAMCLPMCFGAHAAPARGTVQITVLDAGLGSSVIVRSARHTLLFDSGDVHGSEGAAVHRLVIPALRALGITRVDRFVMSSMSASRVIGAATLSSNFPISDVRAAGPWSSADVPTQRCSAAERWQWDGVDYQWLATGESPACVLQVRSGIHGLLLTGSIDSVAQESLLQRPGELRSDIVVTASHAAWPGAAQFAAAAAAYWTVGANDATAASRATRWRTAGANWAAPRACGALQFTLSASGTTPPTAMFASTWDWPWRATCPRQ